MSVLAPVWLLLIVPAALLLYLFRPPTRLLLILRAAVFTLTILAMSQLALRLPGRSGTVIVVADRSASMKSDDLLGQQEITQLITGEMSPREQLGVVAFGRDAALEHSPQPGGFAGFLSDPGADQSNLGVALDKALTLIPHDGVGRILVLSDGHWTGPDPNVVAGRAAARRIPIDFRLQERASANDLAIDRVVVPERLEPGESFMITAWVLSPVRQEVTYELTRGSTRLAAGQRQFVSGVNRLVFRDTAGRAGTQQYRLRVLGALPDSRLENNEARLLAGIRGARPVLCVSASPEQGFARLLQAGGLDIIPSPPGRVRWSLADLSNYSAVILENVFASEIGPSGMELLAAWLEDSGAGLMMTGGKNAYGPGGYFRSPLERVMPVSMELKKEHRKFSLAIAIAMDRSGSMGASAGLGRTKMDLANIGAVQVMDLLSNEDEIGVIAVDSSAHTVVDMAPVSVNRSQRDRILGVQSMGGGIFVYEALEAATRMLIDANAQTRHIILFADAADSEHPHEYVELLETCAGANITCSVIGLGTEDDSDAALLRDVARMGDGQCFFSNDAREIPRLFAQDTFAVSRSALVEEPTVVNFTAGYARLSTQSPGSSPTIGGYNLCYVRPEATLAAMTSDSYKAPVIAFWHAGRGRVLCYTGEADGEFTGPIAQWPDVGETFASMARWTAGDDDVLSGGMQLVQDVRAGVCRIELHLDPERTGAPFHGLPQVNVLHGVPGAIPGRTRIPMTWDAADLLVAEFPLHGKETALPTVAIPGHPPMTLSPACLPYSPEFRPSDANRGYDALKQLADITGGEERMDVSGIWKSLPTQPRTTGVAHWLYALAVILLLADVLQRRTGILSGAKVPAWKRISFSRSRDTALERKAPSPQKLKRTSRRRRSRPAVEAETASADSTISALQEARKRARGRTRR